VLPLLARNDVFLETLRFLRHAARRMPPASSSTRCSIRDGRRRCAGGCRAC
jgi:hypothetical protein